MVSWKITRRIGQTHVAPLYSSREHLVSDLRQISSASRHLEQSRVCRTRSRVGRARVRRRRARGKRAATAKRHILSRRVTTEEEETNVLSRFDDEGVGVGAHRIFFHARRGEEPGRFGEDAAREE